MQNNTMNGRQKLTILAMDVLLIFELTLGMYFGWRNGEDFSGAFVRFYVPTALLTVVGCLYLARRFRDKEPEDGVETARAAGESR